MKRLLFLLLLTTAWAGTPELSKDSRIAIERFFTAEMVFSRATFPCGQLGLTLKDDKITPEGRVLDGLLLTRGIAAKPGDKVQITKVTFHDNFIRFEINGGPTLKEKWYRHVQVGGAGGSTPIADTPQTNPHGSYIDVVFPGKHLPEMTPEDVKKALKAALDFDAQTAQDAFLGTVPPKAKEAILAHKVLVGMTPDMVAYSLGRPPKRDHEADENGREYEEWIYGESPADVIFVRFQENEVVRVEIVRVGQDPEIRTERELELPKKDADNKPPVTPSRPPTLKRPGEQ